MAPPVIDFRRSYLFGVPPGELWSSLEDERSYERWWPWLREFSVAGHLLDTGAVMRGVVVPPLPYRMRIEVELTRCVPPVEIDAQVRGDLEGRAELRIAEVASGSRVEAGWRVEMLQRPMRLASRFAHPMLRRGHDWVVDLTVQELRRHLKERGAA